MTGQLPDAAVLAPATTAAELRPARRAHHGFYAWAGAAAFAIVFAGFARTYYLKVFFGAPALPWLLHFHGMLMTSWFVLFFAQTYLIAAHRVPLHRRLGVFGATLAILIVTVGATVALRFGAREMDKPQFGDPPALAFMGFLFAALLLFTMLVGAALLLRRRREYHKRLMLLSCLSMIGPGLTRIPFNHVPALLFLRTGGSSGLFGLDLLVLYACVAYDTWRHRRLHPAFAIGVLLLAALNMPFIWLFLTSPAWTHFATRLVSLVA